MRVVVAGIMGRYPFGGVAWCSLMYLLGLRTLGHEVYYVEDTGECVYDPDRNAITEDPGYAVAHVRAALHRYGLGDRWSFVNYDGTYYGGDRSAVGEYCASADLFLNVSGGSWFWRDEYLRIPRRVFVDSDPAFTQISLVTREASLREFFGRFDHVFTFGSNVGTPASPLPSAGLHWHKTWQPIVLDEWPVGDPPVERRFSTVMTWKIKSFADIGGNKDQQFARFIDLPARVGDRFELAVNGPHDLLRSHGWRTVDAMSVSRGLDDYRAFIRRSYAEFGVAKHTYVVTNSGWFSDRTECYLASGRPALVQDTGWTAHLPHGRGLLAFTSLDEAADGIARIDRDYALHARDARAIAEEHFRADVVLPRLLDVALT